MINGFLSFDENNESYIGRIWITDKNENDELVASFAGKDKNCIIEQAKEWAFENNYDIEW